jgi:hypothetical protein
MSPRHRVTVAGPLSRAVAATVTSRFTGVGIGRTRTTTVLDVVLVDQPALRALLTLLWDAGHDVRSVESLPEEVTPS